MEIISDSDLTEEQLRAIDAFCQWYRKGVKEGFGKRPKFKLAGPAGSGKSTLAYYALQAIGLDPLGDDVAKVAYTGKAAMVMCQKGLVGSGTIHKNIYIPLDGVGDQIREMRSHLLKMRGTMGSVPLGERPAVLEEIDKLAADIKELQERSSDEMQWILNPSGAVAGSKLVMCDESSMVGGKIQADLESFDVPIFYLGDGFQLPPVVDDDDESESVFFDKNGILLPMDFELTQIHRQAEGSPIIRYSRALRENRQSEINFFGKMVGEDGSVFIRVPRGRITVEHLAAAEQVIVGKNDTRHRVNAQVRAHLGRTSNYPEPGDKVIFLKNNKEFNVVNGMLGVVQSDYYDVNERAQSFKATIELEDGRVIDAPMLIPYFQSPGDREAMYEAPGWSRKKNLHVDYSVAITCHKAQGSQYGSGIVLNEPLGKTEEMQRRWQYTGDTRFANSLIVAA